MSLFPAFAATVPPQPFRPARDAVLRAGCAVRIQRSRRKPLAML